MSISSSFCPTMEAASKGIFKVTCTCVSVCVQPSFNMHAHAQNGPSEPCAAHIYIGLGFGFRVYIGFKGF